jgi:hypothetical protein
MRVDVLAGPDGEVQLTHETTLIATAKPTDLPVTAPAPPSFAEAREASMRYSGFVTHPFPTCFVCGPLRSDGDGLRIFPGTIAGRPLVAAPWVPDGSLADAGGRVRSEFLWAALDCTSCFAFLPLPGGATVVLGEISASVHGVVQAGEECVAVGWALGHEGRKHWAGSAVYSSTGAVVGVARTTWIEIAPEKQ